MLHSGIDLHKRTIAIATVTPDGQPVRDAQAGHFAPGYSGVLRVDARAAPCGGGIHLALVLR